MAQSCRHRETMEVHPAERALLLYLRRLGFGVLEKLQVQNGLPVSAEEVRGKVRFTNGEK